MTEFLARCCMCGGTMRSSTPMLLCAHCDVPHVTDGCAGCQRTIAHRGIGPRTAP